jgi:hypothetical protein
VGSNHRDPNHTPGNIAAIAFDSGAGIAGFKDLSLLSHVYDMATPVIIGGIVACSVSEGICVFLKG